MSAGVFGLFGGKKWWIQVLIPSSRIGAEIFGKLHSDSDS